ncbi:MAG: hypothetical protein WCL46_06675 [Chlorobium sp.]|jgi:hypothetical protein
MKEKTMPVWAKKVVNIFSIFQIPRVPEYGEAQKARCRKEVVRQTSNGNVLLQLGHYLTAEEIDRMKKDLAI